MAFDDDEKSVSSSAPIELYVFTAPAVTYRLTTYHKDVVYGGFTYTATPASRSSLGIVDVADDSDALTVEIPATHALAQQYANGIPPRDVFVTVHRYQQVSGTAIQLWDGYISSMSFRERVASMRIPSTITDALSQDCPGVCAQRICNHVLYDARCGISEAAHQVSTTIASISTDGRTIVLAGPTPGPTTGATHGPDGVPWARHGFIIHSASGERRTIISQSTTTVITIQVEFPRQSLTVGDAVIVQAGCDHRVTMCRDKFANALNFGGHPDLPESNPFYISLVTIK